MMASKKNQKLMNKLCNEILTIRQFNTNRDVILRLQKAIDDLELYKKAFNEALDKIVRPYKENKELREILKNEFLDKARKELENGK